MSENTKKVEKTQQEAKAVELSEQDLDKVAGGAGSSSSSHAAIQDINITKK
jgi:hypothetical protein